jgi:uncharacterized protein YpbB
MSLAAEPRRALVLLATTQRVQDGATEALMLMNGFQSDMLAGLVFAGFATVVTETMRAGAATVEVERYRITDEGRAALAAGA